MLKQISRIYITSAIAFIVLIALSITPSWGDIQDGGSITPLEDADSLNLVDELNLEDSLILEDDLILSDSLVVDSLMLDSLGFDSLRDGRGRRRGLLNFKRDTSIKQMMDPLESYFFSDSVRASENFIWSVDKDYNRVKIGSVDTTLADWRIDYVYQKDGVGDMSLGGLGQASQAISQYNRANYNDRKFAQPFDSYIFTIDNAPFYNVKKATTQFQYLESGQTSYRESNFEIRHAQNITPSSGFALDYRSRSTKGQYSEQATKNHNLAFTVYHTGKQYTIQAGYLNNDIYNEENGGIVGIWAIRDSIFEMPSGVPMVLGTSEARNTYKNNTIFIKQSYGIPLEPLGYDDLTMSDKSAIYIGHTFEYNKWSKLYTDIKSSYDDDLAGVDEDGNYVSETYYYYDNWYIDPETTRDSIMERVVSNRLFIQAQPWSRDAIIATLDGGIGVDVYTYSQFDMSSYITGEYNTERFVSNFFYGSASGSFKRYFKWNGEIKVHPAGYRSGDTKVGANAVMSAYLRNKPLILSGSFSNEHRSPSYWQENLFSNHYIFNTPLSKENITRAEVTLSIPDFNFELSAKELLVDNMIYYDNDCMVTQQSGVTSITELYLRKNFKWGGLNLDHRVLAQWSSNEIVAPVPDFSVYLSYYYEFWAEKLKVLRLQIGVDCRYTTKYYMPDYNPALSTFFNQRSESIGGYPYTDVYVSAKWKRMRILIKYQHINQYVYGNDEYFTVATYPQNPGALKMGFSWMFYD